MKNNMKFFGTTLITLLGAVSSALAAPFAFTNGDLILGFQATGGQGSGVNVFFNLGSGTSHRDNGTLGTLGNLATTLSAQYGATWYSRPDLFFGVIGNLNSQPNSGIGSKAAAGGDPSRTVYVSRDTLTPGQGLLWSGYSTSALGIAGNSVSGMEAMLPLLEANSDGSATLTQTTQSTEWNNGWTFYNPSAGAFNIFTGGIQQSFGKGGSATYVDLQRILSTNTGASPAAPTLGTGSYETTISVGSDGSIKAQSATPASSYDTWMASFPSITAPADMLAGADPDKDEIENVLEFVLNGNPSVSSQSILPTLDSFGANFVFNFTRRADSTDEVTQVFEYSTDLVDWTTNSPITIPTTPGTVGFATVGASTGTAPNLVQAVTLTIPKGSNTKLFGRLKAVK